MTISTCNDAATLSQLPDINTVSIAINSTTSIAQLDSLKTQYFGKAGIITTSLQALKTLDAEQKKQFGSTINQFKQQVTQLLEQQHALLSKKALTEQLNNEAIDVTLPASGMPSGTLHPVTLAMQRMLKIFTSLGFNISDGPEIENDYYNFQALNIPDNHPARAMQDTFYLATKYLLRTHTSPIQIRFAENRQPPIKVIAPGRVYRIDMDRTHSPMFHQLEGLWIEKNISFANLKWLISEFLQRFFHKPNLEIRFRASFFPFTEPSAEVDIKDKDGRWLEVAGCGMVHPQVLKNMHIDNTRIDSERVSGFAFGLGIDRFAMLYYGINDLRSLFDNDLDFLRQFNFNHEIFT